jgi:hypothetical protein
MRSLLTGVALSKSAASRLAGELQVAADARAVHHRREPGPAGGADHELRNLLAHAPHHSHAAVTADFHKVVYATSAAEAQQAYAPHASAAAPPLCRRGAESRRRGTGAPDVLSIPGGAMEGLAQYQCHRAHARGAAPAHQHASGVEYGNQGAESLGLFATASFACVGSMALRRSRCPARRRCKSGEWERRHFSHSNRAATVRSPEPGVRSPESYFAPAAFSAARPAVSSLGMA